LGGKVEEQRRPLSPESADAFTDLLGTRLQTHFGALLDTADALENATMVGLYFAAEWCAPCFKFMPKFSASYENHLKTKGLKVIVISADKSLDEFNTYFNKMPYGFLALPYDDRDLQKQLIQKYEVAGFPTLVFLNLKAQTVTKDGKKKIKFDPEGNEFPWAPSLAEVRERHFSNSAAGLFFLLLCCGAVAPAVRHFRCLRKRAVLGAEPLEVFLRPVDD
jgi:thiol-disulfide isomerase/thioredoxin